MGGRFLKKTLSSQKQIYLDFYHDRHQNNMNGRTMLGTKSHLEQNWHIPTMVEICHLHHQQTIIITILILIIIINDYTQDGIVGPLKQGSELSLKCKSEGGGEIIIKMN